MKNKFRLVISLALFLIMLSMMGVSTAEISTNVTGTIEGDCSDAICGDHTHNQSSEKNKSILYRFN